MINGKITFFSNRALINALLQKPGYSRTPTYAAPPVTTNSVRTFIHVSTSHILVYSISYLTNIFHNGVVKKIVYMGINLSFPFRSKQLLCINNNATRFGKCKNSCSKKSIKTVIFISTNIY